MSTAPSPRPAGRPCLANAARPGRPARDWRWTSCKSLPIPGNRTWNLPPRRPGKPDPARCHSNPDRPRQTPVRKPSIRCWRSERPRHRTSGSARTHSLPDPRIEPGPCACRVSTREKSQIRRCHPARAWRSGRERTRPPRLHRGRSKGQRQSKRSDHFAICSHRPPRVGNSVSDPRHSKSDRARQRNQSRQSEPQTDPRRTRRRRHSAPETDKVRRETPEQVAARLESSRRPNCWPSRSTTDPASPRFRFRKRPDKKSPARHSDSRSP